MVSESHRVFRKTRHGVFSARGRYTIAVFLFPLLLLSFSVQAQFTDLTENVEPWSVQDENSNILTRRIGYDSGNGIWAISGLNLENERFLKTTSDLVNFTDHSDLFSSYADIWIIESDSTVTLMGGGSGYAKTTTDFVNFSDRTSALGFWPVDVLSADSDGTVWALGRLSAGWLKTTTDFINFSDRTSALGFYLSGNCLAEWNSVNAIKNDGQATPVWAVGSVCGQLKTTTDFINFSDRMTRLNLKNPLMANHEDVNAIETDGTVWAIGGIQLIKTTENFINFSDRSTAANLGYLKSIRYAAGVWVLQDNISVKTTTDWINFSDRTSALGRSDESFFGALSPDNGTPTWMVGATGGILSSTTDFIHWTDRSKTAGMPGGWVYTAAQDGTTWVVAGNTGEFRTSTNLVNFTDRTGDLGFSGDIRTVLPFDNPVTWTIGGAGGEFATASSDFSAYSDRTTELNFFLEDINVLSQGGIDGETGNWLLIAGNNSQFRTTQDLINFSDRTTEVCNSSGGRIILEGFTAIPRDIGDPVCNPWHIYAVEESAASGTPFWVIGGAGGELRTSSNLYNDFTDITLPLWFDSATIYAIESYEMPSGRVWWALGGAGGELLTTTDFINFTDRFTAAGFLPDDIFSIEIHSGTNDEGIWLIGAEDGTFKTTTDFLTFTDRTTVLDFGGSADVRDIETNGDIFLVTGQYHQVVKWGGDPLAVTLVSFDVRGFDSEVQVFWATGSELHNVGFNLYRAAEGESTWTLLTPRPIQGLNTSEIGGKYLFRDLEVENGRTYYYYLEDIDYFSGGTLHGPRSGHPMASLGEAKELSEAEKNTYAAIVLSSQMESLEDPLSGNENEEDGLSSSLRVSAVSTGPDTSTLEFWIPAGSLTQGPDLKDHLEIEGFSQYGLANLPVVPYRGLVVGVPCRSVLASKLTVFAEDHFENVDLALGSVLTVYDAEGHEVEPFGDGVDPAEAEVEEVPGQWDEVNGVFPARYFDVGAPQCLSTNEARLTLGLIPVQYRAGTKELTQARHFKITLEYGLSLSPAMPSDPQPVQQQLAMDPKALKIAIDQAGLYRISVSDLLAQGWPDWLQRETLRLFFRGHLIPLLWTGEPTGPLADAEALVFYADWQPTRQSKENVYWLTYNVRPPQVLGEKESALEGETVPLWTKVHAEVNRLYMSYLQDVSDRFFWQAVYWHPSFVLHPPMTFTISELNTDSEAPATLRYALHTGNKAPDVKVDHHLQVFLNNHLVDDFTVEGIAAITRALQVPGSQLQEGDNTLEVVEVGDLSENYVMTMTDWVEVEYPRTSQGSTPVTLWAQEDGLGVLSDFAPGTSVEVWDLTDPERAQRITNTQMDEAGTLTWGMKAQRRYGITEEAKPVLRLWANTPSQLRELAPRSTLYITHKDFLPAANRLAEYRRQHLRPTVVVDVEDIYDEYGDGAPSDAAITGFVQDYKARWGGDFTLLLWGDATIDPWKNTTTEFRNFVPTNLSWIAYFETGSDTRLAYGDAENPIGIRVGRIPVLTLEAAERVVDKIMAYEATDPQADWRKKIVTVSDNPTQPWEEAFETFSLNLQEQTPEPFEVSVALLRTLGTEDLHTSIINHFNDGTLLMNFVGHGAFLYWAEEMVLQPDDLALLTNADRLPLVTAFNCLNGYFVSSTSESLAEAMLKSENGAVVYLSNSGLNSVSPIQQFGESLYRHVTTERPSSFGHAVAKEKERLSGLYTEPFLQTLHYFGDPDLTIPGISPERIPARENLDLSVTKDGPTDLTLHSPTAPQPQSGCGQTHVAHLALLLTAFLGIRQRKRSCVEKSRTWNCARRQLPAGAGNIRPPTLTNRREETFFN